MRALLILVLLQLPGCLGANPAPPTECVGEERLPTGSSARAVTIWIGNETSSAACIEIEIGGEKALVEAVSAGRAGLPASYGPIARFDFDGSLLAVAARDRVGGASGTASFATTEDNHIILSVEDDQIRIQHSPTSPSFG